MHGSESPEFRAQVSRMPGPRLLSGPELARLQHETMRRLAPAHGFDADVVPAWMDLGLPRRRLLEEVAEVLLEGRIADHARAVMAPVGPVRLSVAVGGVCREFVDVEVRDAVLELARDVDGEEISFSEAAKRVASALGQMRERAGSPE